MPALFVYGTLCHRPLLDRVAGPGLATRDAALADHAVYWAEGGSFPLIRAEAGATARGVLLRPDASAMERLDFYEGGFDYTTRVLAVRAADGEMVEAQVYFPAPGRFVAGEPWDLELWRQRWAATAVRAAERFMAALGTRDAAAMAARYPQMLIAAASAERAAPGGPTALRRRAAPGDVAVAARHEPYAHFFSVEEYDLAFRRFDGTQSATVNRAAFVSGDAVTVLPYDPVRDRVMLVEQFRAGAYARGDGQPWVLEPIAGRIDAGETPQEAARREAVEEAHLALGALHPVGSYYPSPGAVSEYLYSYVALAELPDGAAGIGGVAEEAEDIRAHVIGYADLQALVASGEAENGPLLISALWLAAHRDRLRAEAGVGGN